MKRRGLLEEGRIGMELAVTAAFEALRSALRTILLLPAQPKWGAPGGSKGSAAFAYDASSQRHPHGGKGRPQRGLRQRLAGTRGFGMLEDLQVWTVSDCILQVCGAGLGNTGPGAEPSTHPQATSALVTPVTHPLLPPPPSSFRPSFSVPQRTCMAHVCITAHLHPIITIRV